MLDEIKKAISMIAPNLGAALGGPLGASAGRALSLLLTGKEAAPDDEVLSAFKSASPETMLALIEVDYNFRLETKRIALMHDEVDAKDRESARDMAKSRGFGLGDALAILITVGFFGLVFLILFVPIQHGAQAIADIMLGTLSAAFMGVVTFHFGSSIGSAMKNKMLEKYIK